jgi:carboxymethylenebutenolidase
MGELITFKRPDGDTCPAYLASSASASAPALVLIQEWWGLNQQMKGLADRMAAQGFRTLVPDLYRGKLATDADEANHMMDALNFMDAAQQDIQGAVNFLKELSKEVAVAGFCMGGALTLISAVKVSGLAAGVCFYGIPPAEAADLSQIKLPLSLHFGTQDEWCSPAAVRDLEVRLKAGGVDYELFSYQADHAFMNEQRPEVYSAENASLAFERATAFLKRNLRS